MVLVSGRDPAVFVWKPPRPKVAAPDAQSGSVDQHATQLGNIMKRDTCVEGSGVERVAQRVRRDLLVDIASPTVSRSLSLYAGPDGGWASADVVPSLLLARGAALIDLRRPLDTPYLLGYPAGAWLELAEQLWGIPASGVSLGASRSVDSDPATREGCTTRSCIRRTEAALGTEDGVGDPSHHPGCSERCCPSWDRDQERCPGGPTPRSYGRSPRWNHRHGQPRNRRRFSVRRQTRDF
jgi:hypothetical protein